MGIEFRNSPKLRTLFPKQRGFTCAGCACKKICTSDLKKIKKRKQDKNLTVISNTFAYIEKQFENAQTSRGIEVHELNFLNQKTSHRYKGRDRMTLDNWRLSMPELAVFLNLTPHQREHWLKKSCREISYQAEFDILLDNSPLLTHESERLREFLQLRNEAVRSRRKYVEMPPVKAE